MLAQVFPLFAVVTDSWQGCRQVESFEKVKELKSTIATVKVSQAIGLILQARLVECHHI